MAIPISDVDQEERKMTKIYCLKCGNTHEFVVVISSVFNVYVNGNGKTITKEPLTEACTGVNRVECTSCHTELLDVGYDLNKEEAYLYKERYAKLQLVHA